MRDLQFTPEILTRVTRSLTSSPSSPGSLSTAVAFETGAFEGFGFDLAVVFFFGAGASSSDSASSAVDTPFYQRA